MRICGFILTFWWGGVVAMLCGGIMFGFFNRHAEPLPRLLRVSILWPRALLLIPLYWWAARKEKNNGGAQ